MHYLREGSETVDDEVRLLPQFYIPAAIYINVTHRLHRNQAGLQKTKPSPVGDAWLQHMMMSWPQNVSSTSIFPSMARVLSYRRSIPSWITLSRLSVGRWWRNWLDQIPCGRTPCI